MHHILVIAMKPEAARRRLWEDGFVGELTKYGVTATPSYRMFPDAVPDTQQVEDVVKGGAFDGVLVTHKLDTEINHRYSPGYSTVQPVTRFSPWAGRYVTYLARVREPGYTETEKVIRHQIDLWTADQGGRLVWTATSESFDPTSSLEVNRAIRRAIAPELAKQGMLPPKK
jgi:hypothetical protein